ncbi:hypothetical protein GCM10007108_15210 [Thermogymnomonas acidicola]|uniref:Peptidase M50 domain-containing protein n=1 Tax=Thermogymnomonas acidicola TaxID=399579 RepID=A0AA37BSF8_9ARCH|nr:site-2 protease family protein [Thermogymnomonas acidicola]GGM77958.1 hypothetical protein GCM10007108_15210 [Thermogymnomonas acidicola]
MISGLEIALIVIMFWIMLILYLAPRIRESKHLDLLGPALMVKAIKRRGILKAISNHFPWRTYSKVSVVIVLLSFFFAIGFLAYGAYLASFIRPSQAPSLSLILALPGINPVIPISYGIVALMVGVFVHEIMHGIVSEGHKLEVKSVGGLFFIVPVGAFVEPKEEELQNAEPVVRRRIYASGPGTNIIIAIVCLLLILFAFAPAAVPHHPGVVVESSDGALAPSVPSGSELISFGPYSGSTLSNLVYNSTLMPGREYNASVYYKGEVHTVKGYAGVAIVDTIDGFPAASAGVPANSIIVKINSAVIYNETGLAQVLDAIPPGSTVNLTVFVPYGNSPGLKYYDVKTVSVYSYYEKYDPLANKPAYKNESFIGVEIDYAGIGYVPLADMKTEVFGTAMLSSPWDGFIEFIGLPFSGLSPVPSYLASMFSVPVNPTFFWGALNVLYWMFWINFLLGITNALPLSILDGAQFLKDTIVIAGRHRMLGAFKRPKVAGNVTNALGVLVLFLLLWEIIVPHII